MIDQPQQMTARSVRREFVLRIAGGDSEYVLFQCTDECIHALDGCQVGDEVEIEFSLHGREWTSPSGEVRYFNRLEVQTLAHVGKAPYDDLDVPPPNESPREFDDIPF